MPGSGAGAGRRVTPPVSQSRVLLTLSASLSRLGRVPPSVAQWATCMPPSAPLAAYRSWHGGTSISSVFAAVAVCLDVVDLPTQYFQLAAGSAPPDSHR